MQAGLPERANGVIHQKSGAQPIHVLWQGGPKALADVCVSPVEPDNCLELTDDGVLLIRAIVVRLLCLCHNRPHVRHDEFEQGPDDGDRDCVHESMEVHGCRVRVAPEREHATLCDANCFFWVSSDTTSWRK
jgi:hypothetical protein